MKRTFTILIFQLILFSIAGQVWGQGVLLEEWRVKKDFTPFIQPAGTFFRTDSDGNGILVIDPQTNQGIVVQKFSPEGLLLWETNFGLVPTNLNWSQPQNVKVDADGNIIICGTEISLSVPFVAVLSKNGSLKWANMYPQYTPGNYYHGLGVGNQGNIYYSFVDSDSSLSYPKSVLLKIDSSGTIVWEDSLINYRSASAFHSQTIDPQGNVITFSFGDDIANWGYYHAHLTKVAPSGQIIWQKEIISGATGSAQNIILEGSLFCDSLGDIYTRNGSGVIRKYSKTDGSLLLSISSGLGAGTNFCRDKNGNFYNSGVTTGGYLAIQKFDSSGNQIWGVNHLPFGASSVKYVGIAMTTEGNLAISGNIYTLPGSAYREKAFFLMANTNGGIISEKIDSLAPITNSDPAIGWSSFPYPTVDGGWYAYSGSSQSRETFFLHKFCGSNCIPSISGTAWVDIDNNCEQDSTETPISFRQIIIQPGNHILSTNQQGKYAGILPPGNYSVSHSLPPGWSHNCPSNGSAAINVTNSSSSDTINFAVKRPLDHRDLKVRITATPARPGFAQNCLVQFSNLGSIPASGVVKVQMSGLFSQFTSTPLADSSSGNTLLFNFHNLNPFESRNIWITCQLPAPQPLGTAFCHTTNISPITYDATPSDNQDSVCMVVTGSFDPNDKLVFPNGPIRTPDLTLQYTIRFQNTGTDTAFNVVIQDTLDENLDLSTFEMEMASHPFSLKNDGRKLTWTFSNILLPDSGRNEPQSHGFLRYSIRPTQDLQLGSTIQNKAAIFFDFNAPILTNTVSNQLIPSKILPYQGDRMQIFPNPAKEIIHIQIPLPPGSPYSLLMTDALGKPVFRQNGIFDNKIYIENHHLPSGLYLLSVEAEGFSETGKLIIQKK